MNSCTAEPIYSYVLGIFLCIGGSISYIPQYLSLIKSKQHKGISELSLFILCTGSAALAANSFILNWYKFECYDNCNFWLCTANLLSLFQIIIGFIMCLPLYLIFIRLKIRSSSKRIIYDLKYVLVHVIFVLVIVIVGLVEKLKNENSQNFFRISAWILGGVISPICNLIVWLPQIVKLFQTKDPGSLSLAMMVIQTPGNLVIIIFQILYHQSITTWITYCVTFVEQLIILIMLIYFKCKSPPPLPQIIIEEELEYPDTI